MKKLLLLLFVIPLFFTACSSDDDDTIDNVLNGTTWVRHVAETSDTYEMDEMFKFNEKTGVYFITQKENDKVIYEEDVDFSYKFETDKKIIISLFNETSEALIEGRKMKFITGYEDEQPIFTKQ